MRSFNQTSFLTVAIAMSLSVLATTGGATFAQSSEPPERPKRMQDPEQFYKSPTSMHGKVIVLPIGTTFEGRIDKTISSEHSHTGQRFNIVIDSPVLVNGSDVVIPTGAIVVGEVVEAVPASNVPHQKWQDKRLVRGKLRVQISGLRMPDGTTYPLVAQLQGEDTDKQHAYLNRNKAPLGTNVGYLGGASSFEASNANRAYANTQKMYNRNAGPKVMPKSEFMKDEVMGIGMGLNGIGLNNMGPDFSHLRSLVLKKRDYWIYTGSPMTIKTTAPLKVGISNPGQGVNVGSLGDEPRDTEFPQPSARNFGGGEQSFGGGNQNAAPSFPPPSQQTQPMAPPQPRNAVPPDSF